MHSLCLYFRDTELISSKKTSIMKVNTTATNEVVGEECTTLMGAYTKENGTTTNAMARECSDSVSSSPSDLVFAWICQQNWTFSGLNLASENRYEGQWKDDKKNGFGKFYHLDTGQMFEGVWVDNVAKCGNMTDFSREIAPHPTEFPIPQVCLGERLFS